VTPPAHRRRPPSTEAYQHFKREAQIVKLLKYSSSLYSDGYGSDSRTSRGYQTSCLLTAHILKLPLSLPHCSIPPSVPARKERAGLFLKAENLMVLVCEDLASARPHCNTVNRCNGFTISTHPGLPPFSSLAAVPPRFPISYLAPIVALWRSIRES
jgi:hypothetical protein